MSCDVGKVMERLENELSFSNLSVTSPKSQLILQPFRRFIYVTAHSPTHRYFTYVTVRSPTLLSLLLRHSSFSNPSVALPKSQLVLQPFFRFSYVAGSSLMSLGASPMLIFVLDAFLSVPTLKIFFMTA